MARLINDSGVLGNSVKVTADSVKDVPFDKVIEAIHKIQDEMGITGTTAKEASETISGSWASVKATWKNLLVGMADPAQDFTKLIDNFVESMTTFFSKNLLPRVEKALQGIGKLIEGLAPVIASAIPVLVNSVIPMLIQAGANLLLALVNSIANNADVIARAVSDVINQLSVALIKLAPRLARLGVDLFIALVNAFASNAELIARAVSDIGVVLADAIVKLAPVIAQTLPIVIETVLPIFIRSGSYLLVALVNVV
jgi:hypothetical protein